MTEAYNELLLIEENQKLKNTLEKAVIALNDFICVWADDMVSTEDYNRASARIKNHGGILAYVAEINEEASQFIELNYRENPK